MRVFVYLTSAYACVCVSDVRYSQCNVVDYMRSFKINGYDYVQVTGSVYIHFLFPPNAQFGFVWIGYNCFAVVSLLEMSLVHTNS